MKVRYIGEIESRMTVMKNKVYECLGIEKYWYRIIDEEGEDYLYPMDQFEVVEDDEINKEKEK